MSRARVLRRSFLAASAALAVVPRYVLGGPGQTPPSEVLTRAVVGTGAMGLAHVLVNGPEGPARQVAVCDVDRRHLARAAGKAGRGCAVFKDFRRLLDRTRPDVVVVATPPHWHGLVALEAIRRGRDVLCEKPLARTIAEGRAVADAARRYARIVAVHTLGRDGPWPRLRAAVAAGLLGRALTVRLGPRSGFGFKAATWLGRRNLQPQPVPPDLDYDLWLGPAPVKPYHPHRVHRTFRGYWDYDGGGLTDMGAHWLDAVHFVLAKDTDGPVVAQAEAPPAHPDAVGPWRRAEVRYGDGTRVVLESGWADDPGGSAPERPPSRPRKAERSTATTAPEPFLEGPDGRVFFDPKRRRLHFEPPGLGEVVAAIDPGRPLLAFEEAVRSRAPDAMRLPDAEAAHRSATVLHLVNLGIRLGRSVRWDPAAERFPGDPEAERLAAPAMRPPWHL